MSFVTRMPEPLPDNSNDQPDGDAGSGVTQRAGCPGAVPVADEGSATGMDDDADGDGDRGTDPTSPGPR